MESTTTNISDLPVDNNTQNIKLSTQELTYNPNNVTAPPNDTVQGGDIRHPEPVSNNTMTEVMAGLQEAGKSGATQLPSRDIPMDPMVIAQDEQAKTNYIPPAQPDYIGEYDNAQDILQQSHDLQKKQDKLDYWYEQLQIPILISLMYFIFQLPAINTILFKLVPKIFNTDGNLNFGGLLSKSVSFGFVYYFITKFMKHISDI